MRRRDFIGLILGSAAARPLVAGAQAPQKWRVGFLSPGSGGSAIIASRIVAFREGFDSSDQLEIVARYAEDRIDKLPELAADLVAQNAQAICAAAPPAVRAAKQVTSSVPIVAMDLESDPVANGWAASLARPGGNVTGIFMDLPDLSAKMLQLFRETVPGTGKIAVLWHPAGGPIQLQAVKTAASLLNVSLDVFEVSLTGDFEGAFRAMAGSGAAGVLILSSPLFAYNPQRLADLALSSRLPAISMFPEFAEKGGLLAYGPDLGALYPQAGAMTRKLLQGRAVADMPIERPTHFRLVANLKTAGALGVSMPTSILVRADQVIE